MSEIKVGDSSSKLLVSASKKNFGHKYDDIDGEGNPITTGHTTLDNDDHGEIPYDACM